MIKVTNFHLNIQDEKQSSCPCTVFGLHPCKFHVEKDIKFYGESISQSNQRHYSARETPAELKSSLNELNCCQKSDESDKQTGKVKKINSVVSSKKGNISIKKPTHQNLEDKRNCAEWNI